MVYVYLCYIEICAHVFVHPYLLLSLSLSISFHSLDIISLECYSINTCMSTHVCISLFHCVDISLPRYSLRIVTVWILVNIQCMCLHLSYLLISFLLKVIVWMLTSMFICLWISLCCILYCLLNACFSMCTCIYVLSVFLIHIIVLSGEKGTFAFNIDAEMVFMQL